MTTNGAIKTAAVRYSLRVLLSIAADVSHSAASLRPAGSQSRPERGAELIMATWPGLQIVAHLLGGVGRGDLAVHGRDHVVARRVIDRRGDAREHRDRIEHRGLGERH